MKDGGSSMGGKRQKSKPSDVDVNLERRCTGKDDTKTLP